MTPSKRSPSTLLTAQVIRKHERRRARWLELTVAGIVLTAVLFVCLTDVGSGESRKPKVFAHAALCASYARAACVAVTP